MSENLEQDDAHASQSFKCPLCHKSYAARSSYVRHSKQCGSQRLNVIPRQKSCFQCSKAKAKCDQRQPSCSRCVSRSDNCRYVSGEQNRESRPEIQENRLDVTFNETHGRQRTDEVVSAIEFGAPILHHRLKVLATTAANTHDFLPATTPETLEAAQSNVSEPPESFRIVANVPLSHEDGGDIRNRWLYPYVEQSPDKLGIMNHSLEYLSRVMRTYPKMMARREPLPPFIHPMQVSAMGMSLPLTNCFTLAKMWEGSSDPAGELITKTIQMEMERLLNEYRNYDEPTLVAAFQALVIYSIILLFPYPRKASPRTFSQVTLVSLQDVAHLILQNSVLPSEQTHSRPTWESWILVNAKRRTLKILYGFDWTYAKLNALPTYPCFELHTIPAPAGKVLWGARTREEWEGAYARWLARWFESGIFTMRELAQVQPGSELDARAEMWLEEADEFGMMISGIVSATEGKLNFGGRNLLGQY